MATSSPLSAVSAVANDAVSWLDRVWSSIADRGRRFADVPGQAVPPLDRAKHLAEALLSERGEASGAAVARELHESLRALTDGDRDAFLLFLSESFTPDASALREAAAHYLEDPTPEHADRLTRVAEPPRQELLRRMNMAPGGTAALVGLREEVLSILRTRPELRSLDSDLRHLFSSWFNRGFLELRRIDWQTPAAVLEKLIEYEAVHEIQGWEDLRRRLAPDRRCFGFFHPALPGEPLIFVEVALTQGLASAVQPLLSRDDPPGDPARADTAIFYSISNCQEGLRGISFGNFLIKQVVEELKAELPQLVRFSTLSPVPGLRRALQKALDSDGAAELLRPAELAALEASLFPAATPTDDEDAKAAAPEPASAEQAPPERSPAELLAAATDGRWWEDPARAEALCAPLMRFCARYLTRPNVSGSSVDPVARFHLGNGARLERVNWLGNVSQRGMRESFGLMVNYLYDRDTIEANHEAFIKGGRVVRSASVEALLKAEAPPPSADKSRAARPAKADKRAEPVK